MGWKVNSLFFLGFLSAGALLGQDTRTVLEPIVPQACTSLRASLVSRDGDIPTSDEDHPDTARLQKAINDCPKGKAVELSADGSKNAFLSGPLKLKDGVTLLVGKGATLLASRNPRDFDVSPESCGKTDDSGRGCKPLLSVTGPNVGIMGDGVIDGQGGAKIKGSNESWWDLAQDAKRDHNKQNCPRLLVADHADNLVLYRITLRNSPNFHAMISRTNGFTAWGVKIDSPAHARNTDGIDPSGSTNVTITNSYIRAGDDNVAIKAGGAGPTTHVSITHNHFYYGHGMSIGSETLAGVSDILVSDLTMDGTTSGIRIKSDANRGGLVQRVTYRDICMRNVKNPIAIDPYYEHNMAKGEKIPVYRNILLQGVHSLTPGDITMIATDPQHSLSLQLDGVSVDKEQESQIHAQFGQFLLGPGKTNLKIAGPGVEQKVIPGTGTALPECQERFVPFPSAP